MMDRRVLQWLSIYEPRTFACLCALSVQLHSQRGAHVPHSDALHRLLEPDSTCTTSGGTGGSGTKGTSGLIAPVHINRHMFR